MSVESKNQTFEELDIVFEDRPEHIRFVASKEQNDKKQGYKELVLNLFEKSPEIGRLLVRLHDRNKLYMIAKSPDDSVRAELTQTVVDLLSFNLTPAEDELISDVLMSLINQAERNLRRALAERLAVMKDVPLRLVLKMAGDEIFVADSVLRKSDVLEDFDLIYIIKSHGAEHWRSIANRPHISNKVIDILADTNDLQTGVNLAENQLIRLSDYSVRKFYERAKSSDYLAKPLLMRDELPSLFVSELYHHVGEELKKYIKDNFPEIQDVDSAIDDIVLELSDSNNSVIHTSVNVMAQAELMMEQGTLTPVVMVDHLRRGQIPSFVAQFSVYCGLPLEKVEEMVRQKTAQTMAIVCKAMLISKSDFTNMFLLTSRARGTRLIAESDLSRAMAYYDRVTEEMAASLLKQFRH